MRVCINKLTSRLIESQSGGEGQKDLDVLIQNAINAGLAIDDVETKYISDFEYTELLKIQPKTAEEIQKEEKELQKETDINTNLPTWQQVSNGIDGISSLAEVKIILKKLARVVYWIAKNQSE